MKNLPGRRIWVQGERPNVVYLYDTGEGRLLQRASVPHLVETAGIGRPCLRHFVAVYVAPECNDVYLQIGRRRFPLDGETQATHRPLLEGLISQLTVRRGNQPKVVVRQFTPGKIFLHRVDPEYRNDASLIDDFLGDIPSIAQSEERRRGIREVKDPGAGPWELVESD